MYMFAISLEKTPQGEHVSMQGFMVKRGLACSIFSSCVEGKILAGIESIKKLLLLKFSLLNKN